ncbi:hypothetical protein D3C77_698150 [compost metagenome]
MGWISEDLIEEGLTGNPDNLSDRDWVSGFGVITLTTGDERDRHPEPADVIMVPIGVFGYRFQDSAEGDDVMVQRSGEDHWVTC